MRDKVITNNRISMAQILSEARAVQRRKTRAATAVLLCFTLFLSFMLPFKGINHVFGTETNTMTVDLNEFVSLSHSSSYYIWDGEVEMIGTLAEEEFAEEYISIYLDDYLEPVIKAEKADMIHDAGKYSFSILLDTTLYSKGYHDIKIYEGLSSQEKEPLRDFSVFFSQDPYAYIINVTHFCNMRTEATTESAIVTEVDLGEPVEVTASVKGQYRSYYDSDIWYKVRYTTSGGTVYEGYIISALVAMEAFADIDFSCEGMVFEDFSPAKKTYYLHIPVDVTVFSFNSIVRHYKNHGIKVYLNSEPYSGDLTQMPLAEGDNVIVIDLEGAEGDLIDKYTLNISRISAEAHQGFLDSLSAFPESYHRSLHILHSMHPEWVFEPLDTGLEWDYVINGQDSGNISLIWYSVPVEYKVSDEIQDGTHFVKASRAAVEYYIDPRNFLSEKNIFMFEQLSYNPDIHTLEGVTKILSGSGLAGREEMFLQAGLDSGVSPYHLAARSRQEVTSWNSESGLSKIAEGGYIFKVREGDQPEVSDDYRYDSFFNFYNIGTGSSTSLTVLYCRGLDFAKGNKTGGYFQVNDSINDGIEAIYPPVEGEERSEEDKLKYNMPWDTEQKAITGGARYIGYNYINIGQDTLYLQKFDLVGSLFSHQYMQNIQAPLNESSSVYRTYSQMENLDNNFVFKIPIYSGMPERAVPKPEDTGKLKSLGIDGYAMTPAFDPSVTTGYQITVPSHAENLVLEAVGFDSRSEIVGTGPIEPDEGENQYTIISTPFNGTPVEYTITVTRSLPEKSADNYLQSLEIQDVEIDRPFDTVDTGTYIAQVLYEVDTVNVEAIPRSDTSHVNGGGIINLDPGTNDIVISVTAENGNVREYTILIERVIPRITSSNLILNGSNVSGLSLSMTADSLKSSIQLNAGTLEVFSKDGTIIEDNQAVGTGDRVRLIYEKEVLEEYIVIIYGDLNGDGKINSADLATMIRKILKKTELEEDFISAADISKDNKVNSLDLAILIRHILRKTTINQLATDS